MAESTRDVFESLLVVAIARGLALRPGSEKSMTYSETERERWHERWEQAEGKAAEWIDTRHNPPRVMRGDECVPSSPTTGRRMADTLLRQQYLAAEPFPHVVIDDYFDSDLLRLVLAEFPLPNDTRWYNYDSPDEHRKQVMDGERAWNVGPATIEALDAMGRTAFVEMVEDVTGIADLIPNITGGGLHQTLRGGYLGMHADATVAFDSDLHRRVNVLLFLNDHWIEACGGWLRLQRDPSDRVEGEWGTEIVDLGPTFNRLVIFETTPRTFHGHPQPWACDEPRRSLACYYYTVDPPEGYERRCTEFR